eukprot:TRINITY_DN8143_c0_g1_i2.p1 TRINITY_DN8143_c0_g1~~TRINITY_DN8143_c0_g1_i2.p1  ORF type:complete len:657 (+),score=172.96 TRINITY_DN8143_c0_g1_i2:24-1994(+)
MNAEGIMPPPGLGLLFKHTSEKKIRRECAIIGKHIFFARDGKICILSTQSKKLWTIGMKTEIHSIIDIDYNEELIVMLESSGALIMSKYEIKEDGKPLLVVVWKVNTEINQIHLCKKSNALYGSKDAEYLVKFPDPVSKVKEYSKIPLNEELLHKDSDGNVVFTVAESNDSEQLLILAKSEQLTLSRSNIATIDAGNEIPLAIHYLYRVDKILVITESSLAILNRNKRRAFSKSMKCKDFIAEVKDANMLLVSSEGGLHAIDYGTMQMGKILKTAVGKNMAGLYSGLCGDNIEVIVSYGGNDYSEHTISVNSIKAVMKESSQSSISGLLYERALNSQVDTLTREIAQNVTSKLANSLFSSLNSEILKEAKGIEEIASDLASSMDKGISHQTVSQQISMMSESLQANLNFVVQKSFAPKFEELCSNMFKDLSKVHREALDLYKKKVECEEKTMGTLRGIADLHIRSATGLSSKMEALIQSSLDIVTELDEMPKLPVKDTIPAEPSTKISKLFASAEPVQNLPEKKVQPAGDYRPLAKDPKEAFTRMLELKDYMNAIRVAAENSLDANCLLKFLASIDMVNVIKIKNDKEVDQTYFARTLKEILLYLEQNKRVINSKVIELMNKAKTLLEPTSTNYGEYQVVERMLNGFFASLNPNIH